MYILDQVRALENEMLRRIKQQGLDIKPRILIVCSSVLMHSYHSYVWFKVISLTTACDFCLMQITRLLPDAVGTTCGERLEKVYDTEHCHILRVPFRTEKGIVRKWISRFEVWPYLETFSEVKFSS